MKKLSFILLAFFYATFSFAQEFESDKSFKKDEVQTVMNSIEIKRISGFGGPTMSFTAINGEFAHLMGGGGGVIINNFFFGGYGEGLTNSLNIGGENSLTDFDFGHGGFWLGYEIARKKLIHPVISTRLGWGNINGYSTTESKFLNDNVFVVTPSISAEVNLTRFFKVNIGAEYRRILNVNNIQNMNDDNFSSLGVYMNFLFGWF